MKRSMFSDWQIIRIFKERASGAVTADVCRRHGISDGGAIRKGVG
jgi:putative transposase